MNVLAFETCRAKNKASDISWSAFIQILCILTINVRGLVVLPGVYLIASSKLLKMNVLAFETCRANNKASDISWSIFIQLQR